MKKIIISCAILSNIAIIAQVPTGGSPPAVAGNPNAAVTNANFAWYRGGNALTGGGAGVFSARGLSKHAHSIV